MPLSSQFIQLFKKLTNDYPQKARGGYLYKRDEHFENIKSNLNSILTIIENSENGNQLFEENTLISYLAISAILYLAEDSSFAPLVSALLQENFKENKSSSFLTDSSMFIPINPDAKNSINVLNELQKAVSNLNSAHQSEKVMLVDQITCLEKEKNLLKEQNDRLRQQVYALESSKSQWEKLSSAVPIIDKIKDAVASLNTLIAPSSLVLDTHVSQVIKQKEDEQSPCNLPNSDNLQVISSSAKIIDSLIPPPPKPPELKTNNVSLKAKDNKDPKLTTPKNGLEFKQPAREISSSGQTLFSELEKAIKKREANKKNQPPLSSPHLEKKNIQVISDSSVIPNY